MVSAKDAEVDKVVGLELGADDYVTKPYTAGELLVRLRNLLHRRADPQASRFARRLTKREYEVLELMAEGLRTSEIAGRLSIAEATVRRHVSSAVAKLGVADRAAAIGVLTGRVRV